MSDLTMFPQPVHIEHRTLEALVFHWEPAQSTKTEGLHLTAVLAELQEEVDRRGVTIERAWHRRTLKGQDVIDLAFLRRVDHARFEVEVQPRHWLVLWLYRERVHAVEAMPDLDGEALFRPSAPIVEIRPGVTT